MSGQLLHLSDSCWNQEVIQLLRELADMGWSVQFRLTTKLRWDLQKGAVSLHPGMCAPSHREYNKAVILRQADRLLRTCDRSHDANLGQYEISQDNYHNNVPVLPRDHAQQLSWASLLSAAGEQTLRRWLDRYPELLIHDNQQRYASIDKRGCPRLHWALVTYLSDEDLNVYICTRARRVPAGLRHAVQRAGQQRQIFHQRWVQARKSHMIQSITGPSTELSPVPSPGTEDEACNRPSTESLQNVAAISRSEQRPQFRSGNAVDLLAMHTLVHSQWFADCPYVPVAWSRHSYGPQRSIRFGSFRRHPRPEIRLHPRCNQPWVPDFFIEYILFHEWCHVRQWHQPIRRKTTFTSF